MQRYVPRLIPAGSAPAGALVEAVIEHPPASPHGEHLLVPQVAWMMEVDGDGDGDGFVHAPAAQRGDLELMRGLAQLAMLDGELANEVLDGLPGVSLATNGRYAAELLLDRDHLSALHDMLGARLYLAGAPRRGRLLVGGVGGGMEALRAFVATVRREHDEAPDDARISPVTLLVRGGAPTAVVGDLQLAALASALGR